MVLSYIVICTLWFLCLRIYNYCKFCYYYYVYPNMSSNEATFHHTFSFCYGLQCNIKNCIVLKNCKSISISKYLTHYTTIIQKLYGMTATLQMLAYFDTDHDFLKISKWKFFTNAFGYVKLIELNKEKIKLIFVINVFLFQDKLNLLWKFWWIIIINKDIT